MFGYNGRMRKFEVYTFSIILLGYARCQLTTNVLWTSCDSIICGPRPINIQCDASSLILITNVTSGQGQAFDEISYANLRRICLGRSICETSKPQVFCDNHKNVQLNVSYVCVKESLIDKSCSELGTRLSKPAGFILSPGYPTENHRRECKWNIDVPENHTIHIYLHEVLKPNSPESCQASSGGVLFMARHPCDPHFPTYPICSNADMASTISACSPLEIVLFVKQKSHALRLWLSYHVVEATELSHVSMFETDITCNLNVLDTFVYSKPVIEDQTDAPAVTNSTDTATKRSAVLEEENEGDEATDTVLYVSVVVGILVFIVVIVVAAIYIRYRYCRRPFGGSSLKENESSVASVYNQSTTSELQRRPLPERKSTADSDSVTGPSLQQAYSSVADEIKRTQDTQDLSPPPYSTYAEIQEYSEAGEKPKLPLIGKRSVDNSKRQLPEKPKDAVAISSLYFDIDDVDAKDLKTEKGTIETKNKRNQDSSSALPFYSYKKKMSNASNIYAECEDVNIKAGENVEDANGDGTREEKPYMDMSHKKKEEPDYVPYSKDSKDKVNQSKRSRVSDKGGKKQDTVISATDVDGRKKSVGKAAAKVGDPVKRSVTTDSDSEDDIVVENELYEPFETAKV